MGVVGRDPEFRDGTHPPDPSLHLAGVAQWQSASPPNWSRRSDSGHLLRDIAQRIERRAGGPEDGISEFPVPT